MMYFLLTGATGLLGRYLLRDMTLADLPLAVIVRPSRREPAAQRIETAMAHWEGKLGRALPRPVVLEGDLAQPLLGLGERDVDWVASHCGAVVHSAASLTFHDDPKTGEPWRSNIEGVRNMISLCRRAKVRRLHHVSTAYVCGRRRGRILESELDVGQEPSNDYERTKLLAEKEVRASDAFDEVTVYRPSIIVGDSRDGYTTSYHGFYTPLRLVHALVTSLSWSQLLQGDFLGRLELAGDERKNLTPVDWVSAAMTSLVSQPRFHGETYHLTNPTPTTVQAMKEVIVRALEELDWSRAGQNSGAASFIANGAATTDFVGAFREQMQIYQSYWSDDPQFDSSATEAALPGLPCPEITGEVMLELARYAIKANFGWPPETPVVPAYDVGSRLTKWLRATPAERGGQGQSQFVSLQVSGQGGGQWHLAVDRGRLVGAGVGLRNGSSPTCYLTSATFARLARGELTIEDSIHRGRLVVAGAALPTGELARVLTDLLSEEKTTNGLG